MQPLESVDEIHHVEEPFANAGADAASGNRDSKVRLASTGATDQHDVTLLGNEAATNEVIHKGRINRRAFELEVVEVFGERQLDDGELVLDRACLLFADLSLEQIADLAIGYSLPTVHPTREFVEAGGLLAYGPSLFALGVRAAWYVDRILKGTKPADLPVEQPTKFELIPNSKTANTLGSGCSVSLRRAADPPSLLATIAHDQTRRAETVTGDRVQELLAVEAGLKDVRFEV